MDDRVLEPDIRDIRTAVRRSLARPVSHHLKLTDAESTRLAGARTAAILRHDLPVQYAGEGESTREALLPAGEPGNLRVSILEAEGLPKRPDGSSCSVHVVVSVAELTRRRARRTASLSGPSPGWHEVFDFEGVSGTGQVFIDMVDVADASGEADLVGKAVLTLDECQPGVPHTFFKNMLEGKLAFRVLFDHGALPDASEEEIGVKASLDAAMQ